MVPTLLSPVLLDLVIPTSAAALIGVALMFSIMFVALLYMLGSIFQHAPLQAMAKEELAAVIFSIVIIAFWLASDSMLNNLTSGLLLSSLPPAIQATIQSNIAHCSGTFAAAGCRASYISSHIDLADASLDLLWLKLKEQYASLYLFEILIGFLSTVTFPVGAPQFSVAIISFSFAPFTGLTLLSQAHTVVVEAISTLMSVIWAKQFILYFARDAIPLLFLPLGLLLRAFPIFRSSGSTLLAICFALYFAYPFALLFSNYIIFDVYKPADFTYMPPIASPFSSSRGLNGPNGWTNQIINGGSGSEVNSLQNEFNAPDLLQSTSRGTGACDGSFLARTFCSARTAFGAITHAVGGIVGTAFGMWKFMIGMTGDFAITLFNNPAMPSSVSSGLFYFIIQEINLEAPFMILVMVCTVMEIIITITAFRNVSLLMGGEAEIIGIGKLI